jgi:tetratricopeptide (TPR) repeat protein
MFKHALTHEVAYNSLLVQRRKELHRLIALAIEELYAERLAEQYEILAYHFSMGEEWAKALEYLLKAAEKAAQAFATREAVALYDQSLEVVGHLGDAGDTSILMAIHQAKADLYYILSDFERSRTEAERLLALARRAGDRVREGVALARMGLAAYRAHNFAQALLYARQAIEVAEAGDVKPILAAGHFITGQVYAGIGQLDQAKAEIDQALAMSRSGGDAFHQSYTLTLAGQSKNWEGEYAEAARLQAESLAIARAHHLVVPLLAGLFASGVALTGKGDYDEALARFEEGLVLSEKVGDEVLRHRLLNSFGWLLIECGDMERAIDLNRRGAEGARKRDDHETIANAELNLGDIFLVQGDLTLAQEFLDGVYRLAHNPETNEWMKWRYSTHLFASLGELWLARGEPARAEEFAAQCLEIATRTNSRKYVVKGWRLLGEIALARRQWDEAEKALQQALTIAQAIGNPTQLWKTHLTYGHLYTAIRKPEMAQQSYGAARDVLERVKGSLRDPGLRASLENSPLMRRVYDLCAP